MSYRLIFFAGMFAVFLSCDVFFAHAEDSAGVVNEWRHWKDRFQERGVAFDAIYMAEFRSNVQGGLKQGETYLSSLDLTLTLDTKKLGWWDHGTFFAYMLHNHDVGKLTEEYVGDLQTVSNIEVPRSVRLHEIWYEHMFSGGQWSILWGQHDFNSEFAVTEHGGLFLNSSFGLQPDIALGGRPSIFPLAAPGMRVKVTPVEAWTLLFGVYDGDPGDPEQDRHISRWDFSSKEGVFLAAEAGYSLSDSFNRLPATFKLGVWGNTGSFDDVEAVDGLGDPVSRDGNYGIYGIIDHKLFEETDGSPQGLAGFLQIGGVPDRVNEVDFYIGGGVSYRGLLPGRDEDDLGVAVAHASISDKLRKTVDRDPAETAIELTYKANICEGFFVQPDVQYVINPGADPSLKDALIFGLRMELAI